MATDSALGAETPGRSYDAGVITALQALSGGIGRNTPCPCGSGKRYKHCCGDMDEPRVSAAMTRELLEHKLRRVLAARDAGDWDGTERLCHEVLQAVPNQVQALRVLAEVKRRQDQPEGASVLLQRMLRYFPHDDELAVDIGEFHEWQGDIARAEQQYQKAVRLDAASARAHRALGRLAQRSGNIGLAEVHLREAHYLEPENAAVAADLGRVLNRMGRKAESEHFFRLALSLKPEDVPALLAWAEMEESRGDLDAAWTLLRRAQAVDPDFPVLPLAQATLELREKRYKDALQSLKQVQRKRLTLPAMSLYYFTRGRVLDALRRYDDAFESFRRANAVNTGELGLRYDPDWNRDYAERQQQYFTAERLARLPRAQPRDDDPNPRPVFVTAFPRSGATLVEQILTRHDNVCAGDEIFTLPDIRNRLPGLLGAEQGYPECLDLLQERHELVYQLREEYLSNIRLAGILEPAAGRFTDKLPLNEWNLGLIGLLFPDAAVIQVVRHPLDAVLSSFFTDVRHGNLCAFNLAHAAGHYALTMDLMQHFSEQLELRWLRVRYEDIVAGVEKETRRMLEFLDEPWQPQCLDFHLNPHYPRSPSYAEVREKLYPDAVHRYKRYRAHLKGITETLAPYVEELGYKL